MRQTKHFGWIPMKSSNIACIAYDRWKRQLYVQFHTGQIYTYYNVPSDDVEGLMTADSVGQYFAKFIKDSYDYVKLSKEVSRNVT